MCEGESDLVCVHGYGWLQMSCVREQSCVCVVMDGFGRVVCEAKSSLLCVYGRVRMCLGSCLSDHWFVLCARVRVMMSVCMYVRGYG